MKLTELQIGQTARILSIGGEGAIRQHFLDMGLIPTAEVTLDKFAPMGDPVELYLHGYHLTLRLADAANIEVGDPYVLGEEKKENAKRAFTSVSHPGLGEDGKYRCLPCRTRDQEDAHRHFVPITCPLRAGAQDISFFFFFFG